VVPEYVTRAHPQRRVCVRRRLVVVILVSFVIGGLSWWAAQRGSDSDRVARAVCAGVPVGSTRGQAEAWVRQTYGVIPTF
jgi:hypothetical protein